MACETLLIGSLLSQMISPIFVRPSLIMKRIAVVPSTPINPLCQPKIIEVTTIFKGCRTPREILLGTARAHVVIMGIYIVAASVLADGMTIGTLDGVCLELPATMGYTIGGNEGSYFL